MLHYGVYSFSIEHSYIGKFKTPKFLQFLNVTITITKKLFVGVCGGELDTRYIFELEAVNSASRCP